VFEVRDIWPLVLIEEGGFSAFNPFVICLKCVEWLGYRYSDAIVGTMPNLAPHVEQVLGFPKKTHCIPMGIDLSLMQKPDKLPVEYLNTYLPRGKFVVGYVGSIGVSNALDTFFQCIEAMVEKDDIHFLIVGDGYLKGKYCQKYGHLKNLTIAESVCKTAVQSILELCDLLYFSAKRCGVWKYGQSLNKLIDYMMAGKPVVASYTGFQSMINESKCGTFVNAEDLNALKLEIERYSKLDQSERLAIGKRGREWLYNNRQYSMLGDEYAKIIQEVFSKNGARIK
jgi:glycosyltransferase involved in cell wall biosynthesis